MAHLNDLSFEMIDNILDHLRDDTTSLGSMCLTSQKLHRIALPHLYHHLQLGDASAAAIMLSLLRNHDLAKLVRQVEVRDCHSSTDEEKFAYAKFVQEVSILSSKEISLVAQRENEADDAQYSDADVDFNHRVTEFILTGLPNLVSLSITISENMFGPAIARCLRNDSVSILPNCKELSAQWWDTEGGLNFDDIIPLLTNTNISKVNVFSCDGFEGNVHEVIPSVRELKMDRSALDREELVRVVKCLPNLELFQYRTADALVTECKDSTVSSYAIGLALEPLKNRLRSLVIDQRERFYVEEREDDDDDDGDPLSREPIGILKAFTRLEELEIWQIDLTGSHEEDDTDNDNSNNEDEEDIGDDGNNDEDDNQEPETELHTGGEAVGSSRLTSWAHKLPRSLKKLKILEATEDIKPELRRLALSASREHPQLRKVVTACREDGLSQVFKRCGIDYEVDATI